MSDVRLEGRDPFDALRGTRVPRWAKAHPRSRQAIVQIRKRSPLELGPVLGVKPFVMAKTAGAMLAAAARAGDRAAIDRTVEEARLAAGNVGDGAWGYEFDVQTRWAFYPAGSPNLIATVFVARGFAEAGLACGAEDCLHEAEASAEFLSDSLFTRDPSPFFKYTLTSDRLVHNANLLGAGLVLAMGVIAGGAGSRGDVLDAVARSVDAQRPDGSWPYGEGAGLGWSDNFHTAYNLDGLLLSWLASGDGGVRSSLERGVAHWVRDFFGPAGEPKYYPDKAHPYDIHSAGTAIDVAARLETWGFETAGLARRVAEWTRDNLIDPRTGATYYQKRRLFTDKRHFVRWGDAHWALGLSSLALLEREERSPLEQAVSQASGVGH